MEEACCFSQHLCFALFSKPATYALNIMQAHTSFSASKRCIFLCTHHCRIWLEVWLVLVNFYWYTGKMTTRYLFYLRFHINVKIMQIIMEVGNTKGAHKLCSTDENTVALHYVRHFLDNSQSGGLCFSLFSHCTEQ